MVLSEKPLQELLIEYLRLCALAFEGQKVIFTVEISLLLISMVLEMDSC